jgi:hypothetical protein
MLKRTMGLSLLGLLVISGLAGTMTNNTLTKAERNKALVMMKDTRAELATILKGLNRNQLNYRAEKGKRNIRECVFHIAVSENKLWSLLEHAMKAPSSPARRAEVIMDDEELVAHVEDRSEDGKAYDPFLATQNTYKTYGKALAAFKNYRTDHIKYLRTSTEDLRNHVVRLSFGTIDCYQLCLVIASHTNRHYQEIKELMNNPGFPK